MRNSGRAHWRGKAGLAAMALTAGLVLVPSSARAADDYWVPISGELTLHGHGFGHGRGMSQYGARGAAMRGLSWQQIIAFYYPGSTLGSAGGEIKVKLTTMPGTRDITVSARNGLTVRDLGTGTRWALPTGPDAWRLHVNNHNDVQVYFHDARGWHPWRTPTGAWVLAGEGEFRGAGPLELWTPSGKRHYRERIRSAPVSAGSLLRTTVNVLALDSYVMGVVPAEMPTSWEPDALRAQAVAARSYAVRHRSAATNKWYDVDDTTSYQVYGGVDRETAASNQAVAATAGRVVLYKGTVALTEFSSSSGGWSAGSSLPYQQTKPDPYDAVPPNSHHDWGVDVTASRLERAYPALGRLQRVEVRSRNGGGDWGGRVVTAVLHGSRGDVTVTGDDLRHVWGLESNWFMAEPTPIISRWRRLGGPRSHLGAVRSPELAVGVGAQQRFDRGRIYWTRTTGARELYGAILAEYLAGGGPAGALRFPVTGELDAGVPGGRFNRLQRGGIYWSKATGAHTVLAGIDHAYNRIGGAQAVGLPTANEQSAGVPGARTSPFQRADIYWSRATGSHPVYGAIRMTFRSLGGVQRLGLPVADERSAGVPGGRVSDFQNGDIYWSRATGAHLVGGAIGRAYDILGGPGVYGLPVADEESAGVPGARLSRFQNGHIYWSRSTGPRPVSGPILDAYLEHGGATSDLGLPTEVPRETPQGQQQAFQGGSISWNATTGRTTIVAKDR